jgi:chemotaxis protein histidine kinase CheA
MADFRAKLKGTEIRADKDLLADFFNDYNETIQTSEQLIVQLEKFPYDKKASRMLQNVLHSALDNLEYLNLISIRPLLESVEYLLKQLNENKLAYNPLLGELVYQTLLITKTLANEAIHGLPLSLSDDELNIIICAVSAVPNNQGSRQRLAYARALSLLNGEESLAPVNPPQSNPPQTNSPQTNQESHSQPCYLHEFLPLGIEIDEDLMLFYNLITSAEQRSTLWKQRSYFICKLALRMNQAKGRAVNPSQLTAAVLMHDFAMTFTPLDVLHKNTPLNSKEKRHIHSHVRYAADFLARLDWEDAAEMVMQHHEYCDGNGYPRGLLALELCDGAKIIAIADTFYACTNSTRHTTKAERLIHAFREIKENAGSQFCAEWVGIFNRVVDKRSFREFI